MKGRVEIYQGYIKNGRATVDEVPIHVDSNLIVDGAKEHIVDFLTRIPAPSGLLDASNPASGNVNHSYDASNFGVRAISFSPNSQAFQRTSALAAASGFVFNPTTSGVNWSAISPTDYRWSYLPDIPNFNFSATNAGFSGGTFTNSLLKNPSFSSVTNYLRDGGFTQYYINTLLSGVHLNQELGLYELSQWDIQSYLRYINNDFNYSDLVQAGSVSIGVFKDSSTMSGVCNEGFAASADNFVYMRSFDRRDDHSGIAGVSTSFSFVPKGIRLGNHIDNQARSMIAELGLMYSATEGGAYGQLKISLNNLSKGTQYAFSSLEDTTRNTWSLKHSPLYCNASAGEFQRLSHFVNIPFDYYADQLELEIFALAGDNTGVAPTKVYIWDAQVNSVDSWIHGHIFSGDNVARYWPLPTGGPVSSSEGLYLQTKNDNVALNMSERAASSVTYISQMFNMQPLKKYSAFVHGDYSGPGADTIVPQFLGVAVRKPPSQSAARDWNYLSTSCSPVLESRLDNTTVVVTPLLSMERVSKNLQIHEVIAAKPKPSDLCIEVNTAASITAHLILPYETTTYTLSGQVLKTLDSVPGKTIGDPEFSLVTRRANAHGHRLLYNQATGRFDLPISSDELTAFSSIPETARLNTSSFSAEGSEYADFEFPGISTHSLQGVVDTDVDEQSGLKGYYLSLLVQNSDPTPGFFKKLSLYNYAPSRIYDRSESFSWVATEPSGCWIKQVQSASGEYFMSGTDVFSYVGTTVANATDPIQLSWVPLEGMGDASGSVHGDNSEYQFILGACNNYQGSPLTTYRLSCAGIVDTALLASTEEISGDIFTSESYLGCPKFDILNQINVQYNDKRFPGDRLFKSVHPGTGFLTPNFGNLSAVLASNRRSLVIGSPRNIPGTTNTLPKVSVNYTTTLEDINVNFGSPFSVMEEGLGFSFEAQQLVSGSAEFANGRPSTLWTLQALLDNGDVLHYKAATEKWMTNPMTGEISNSFVSRVNRGAGPFASYYKTMLSKNITLNDSRFTPTTKLAFNVVSETFTANDVTFIKDWKFFRLSQTKGEGIGQFPTPVDTVLQTQHYADETIGELGQFTNNIQFYSVLSGTTYDRALGNGGWPPSRNLVGIHASGVQLGSWSNDHGVINSDGFLYPSPTNSPVYPNFYGDGFILGASANGNTSSIYFIYDISSKDMQFLDLQGGVGAMGLWTFDVEATYKKMVEYNHNVSSIYDYTASPLASSLYKLTDPTRNPVFKLFAKKVFREPIAFNPAANHFTRFVWHIRMV